MGKKQQQNAHQVEQRILVMKDNLIAINRGPLMLHILSSMWHMPPHLGLKVNDASFVVLQPHRHSSLDGSGKILAFAFSLPFRFGATQWGKSTKQRQPHCRDEDHCKSGWGSLKGIVCDFLIVELSQCVLNFRFYSCLQFVPQFLTYRTHFAGKVNYCSDTQHSRANLKLILRFLTSKSNTKFALHKSPFSFNIVVFCLDLYVITFL